MAITFKVGFQVDDKNLKQGLQGIQNDIQNAFNIKTGMSDEIAKATQQAMILEKAIKRATTDKGVSFYSLNSELQKAGTSAAQLTATLVAGGKQFQASLNAANTAFATADRSLLSLNSKIKEMSRVITQSFKFTAAQTFLQGISNAAQEAYQWVYNLDKTVTNIGVVTGYTGDQLEKVTQNAIAGAKELRIAANDYAEGALIFYQQGLGDDEVARRVEITAKSARAAGTSLEEMSSQLTAIWNTYKMTGDEMERAASVGAKMAGDTAVDFADIAEAMQTAAAPAEQMGVSYNSLAAIIATVGDTTQQSASVIGNAFKTIFSRFQQLKSEGTDGEVTLNRVSSQLQELGVNVLDSSGQLRQLDDVITEVGNAWDGWSSKQQLAIAQLVGGTRQYGQFLTLMNNFDKYQELLSSANMEDGSTLTQQYEASLDSIESKAENAGEAWRRAFGQLLDEDTIKTAYELLEGIGNLIGGFIDSIGGLPAILGIVATLLSSKIVPSLANGAKNALTMVQNITPNGRKDSINKEYDQKRDSLDTLESTASTAQQKQQIAIQKQKNEFDRQTALINDQINTKLTTATGKYKIILEYQKQQIKNTQQLYQASLDNLQAMADQATQNQKNLELEQKRAQLKADQSNLEVSSLSDEKDYQSRIVAGAQDELDNNDSQLQSARQELENARERRRSATTEDEKELANLDIAEAQDKIAEYTDKVRNSRAKLRQETQKLVEIEEKLKKAQDKKGQDDLEKNTKDTQKAVESLTEAYGEFGASGENLDKVKEQAKGLVDQLHSMGDVSDGSQHLLNNLIDNASEQTIDAVINKLKDLTVASNNVTDEVIDNISRLDAAQAERGNSEQYQQRQQTTQGEVENGPQDEEKTKQSLVDIASGLVEIGTAGTVAAISVSSVFDAIREGKDAGDIFTTIGGSIVTLIPTIGTIIGALTSLNLVSVTAGTGITVFGKTIQIAGITAQSGWLWITGIIAAITIFAGLAISFGKAIAEAIYNASLEGQLEAANEELDAMNSLLDATTEKVDNLKNAWDKYDEVKSTLDNCTKGTEEWEDALAAVNQQVLEILQTYPELAQYVNRDMETGELQLDEQGYEEYLKNVQGDQAAAQAATFASQNRVNELENDIDKQDIVDDIASYMSEAVGGTMKQSTKDMLFDNMDRLVGLTGDDLRTVLKQINDENGNPMQDKYMEDFALAIENSAADINTWDIAVRNAAEAAELQAEEVAKQYLQSQEFNLIDNMESIYGQIYNNLLEQAKADLSSQYKDTSVEDVAKDFSDQYDIDLDKAEYDGDTVTLEDGTEYTKEQMIAALASAEALDNLTTAADGANTSLQALDNKSNEVAGSQEFKDFFSTGNFNSMTEDDINRRANYDDKMMTSWLENIFDTDDLEATAKSLGYDGAQDMINQIRAGFEISKEELKNIGKDMSETAKNIFNDIDMGNTSVAAQQSVANLIQKAFEGGGYEGADAVSDLLNGVFSELDEEDAAKFASTLNQIDWQNVTPDGLRKQLELAGFEMDNFTNDSLQFLIDTMVNGAAITREAAQESYNKYNDIGKDLDSGSILSEKDFNTLTDNGTNGMAQYFTKMRDGTYQLTGDATKFYQELRTQSEMSFNYLAQAKNQLQQDLNATVSNINSGVINEDNIGVSAVGHIEGQEIKDAQLAYLNQQNSQGLINQEDLKLLTEWNNQLTFSVDDYNQLAEMAQKYGISLDGILQAQNSVNTELAELDAAADASRIQGDLDESGTSWEDLEAYRAGIKQTIEAQEDMAESSKDFSDALLDNEQALNEVSKEQARFTEGLQTAGDNMEDWKEIWDDNGTIKDYQKFSDSMEDIRDAYSDLLDVDGSSLSEDFLASAENMELLETVLTGSAEEAAEALAQLQENAIIDLDLDMDTTELQGNIQTVQDQLAGLAAGTEITPTVDNTAFFTALNDMIAACGTDMAKIEALCNNLNIEPLTSEDLIPNEIGADVEADTTTVESEGKNEATSYDVQRGGNVTMQATLTDGPADIDIGSGTLATISIPTWDYVPKKETEETVQETPVTSYKIKPGTGITTTSSNKTRVNRATPPTPTNYRGGSSKPSSGGGGNSGSKSTPEHKAKKASKYDPITDRYATIKSSIDEVQRSVDALSDAEDDAWGGDKVRNMQKINAELQRQGRNLQKLRKLTLDYLEVDKKDAQIAAKDLITNLTKEGLPGLSLDQVLFNSDGFVSNRTEITSQLNKYLESLYTPYYEAAMKYDRANSTDEAESERIDKLKDKYDIAKSFVDEFLAALDLVDETAQEAADALEQQLENIRTWMANKVEEATYKMEFKIGISDRDISLIEQAIELWGDLGVKMGKTFDLLGSRLNEETSQFYDTLEHGNRMIEIIENIDPTNAEDAAWFKNEFGEEAWNEYISGNGGLPAEVLEAMQDDANSMIDYMNTMYDTAEEMFGQYIEVLNLYMDEFDKIADKISANNDKLEMFQELLEFSGRRYTSAGRNSIRNIANASVDNAVLEVERATGALKLAEQGAKETSQQLEDFLRDTNKDPADFDDVEAFTYNQLKAAKDEADQILADAQSDMTASISDLASAAADAIEMVAEVIKEEVAANLGGDFASIDDMMTMYDQQYDLDTFFLRDFDKEYQLNTLLGDINDQMEDITDPERLKEYESLIEEINAANEEGVQLTQTDVDLLKAKFEIQKAQDAYEEAQNAKNTMRLARDASGNWSYVYSAESTETEDAAQKLADAQYNYEKLLWEASDEASQYWLQAQQDFFQFQETIDWARYEHDEQYKAQIDKQLQYYQEKTELYAAQVTKYNDMLGVSFDETSLGVVTNMQDMESAQEWYTQQHEYYTNELNANTQHYQQVVADACNKVGISYDELERVVDSETTLMMQENDELRGTIEKLNTEGGRALSQLNTKVTNFRVKFVEDMKLATAALTEFLNKLEGYENESLDRMEYTGFDAETDYTAAINNYIGEQLQAGKTSTELMSDENLKKLAYELGNKLNSDMLNELGHTTVQGNWNDRTSYNALAYMTEQIAAVMDKISQGIWKEWDTVDEWSVKHREEIANYGKTASGGLVKTPQVRSLAEEGPELVLNSSDTQNILEAVKNMREIVKMKMTSMNSDIQKKTEGNTQKTVINKDIQQLDQQVHIDATFPNVSVAAEIEEAFNNLVNQAVQYASRK